MSAENRGSAQQPQREQRIETQAYRPEPDHRAEPQRDVPVGEASPRTEHRAQSGVERAGAVQAHGQVHFADQDHEVGGLAGVRPGEEALLQSSAIELGDALYHPGGSCSAFTTATSHENRHPDADSLE